jgi:hypothetical protein
VQDFVQDFGLFEREEILHGILQKPPQNSRFFLEVFARFLARFSRKIPSRPPLPSKHSTMAAGAEGRSTRIIVLKRRSVARIEAESMPDRMMCPNLIS